MLADRNARALMRQQVPVHWRWHARRWAYLSHSCSRGLVRLAKSRMGPTNGPWTGPWYWKTPVPSEHHDMWPSDLDQPGNPPPHRRVLLVVAAAQLLFALRA